MSTLILYFQIDPREPIIIAANRDSTLERPTTDPRIVEPGVFRPVDGLYGGSWFGFNDRGLAAVVTHKFNGGQNAPSRSVSRGLLVSRALTGNAVTAESAIVALKRPWDCYRSHHLLVASQGDAQLLVGQHNERAQLPINERCTVVTSRGHWPDHSARACILRKKIEGESNPSNDLLDGILQLHDDECGEDGACVHGTYPRALQTRASLIARLRIDADGPRWIIRWRNGRPCENQSWSEYILPIVGRR